MTEFADLPEHQATGRIAEIYDDIRVYGGVPYVSSLQRQLATIPGCLEWVWDAVRPAFIDGRVPQAAWGAVNQLDLPAIAPIPRPALRVLGVDADGEAALHSIYETFLRASPVNMVTASLMGHLLDGEPDKTHPSAAMCRHGSRRRPGIARVPDRQRTRCGHPGIAGIFRGRYGWGAFRAGLVSALGALAVYLAHVAVAIGPLFKRDDIVGICSEIVSWIDSVVPPLTEGLSAGPPPFDAETTEALRGPLRVYRGLTSPQMIVFSAILRDALPETSSI